MKKRIIAMLLVALMTVSFLGSITASAAAMEKLYTFSNAELAKNGGDDTTYKYYKDKTVYEGDGTDNFNLSLLKGFGVHGWKYFDHKLYPETATLSMRYMQLANTSITSRTSHTGVDTLTGIDTALELTPPSEKGFYTVSYNVGATSGLTAYIGEVKAGKDANISDYINDTHLLGEVSVKNTVTAFPGKVIYSDAETNLVYAWSTSLESVNVNSLTLKKVDTAPTFSISTTEIDTLSATSKPDNAKISVKVGSNTVVDGFVKYESKNNDIATVDENGVVKAVSGGQAKIVATVGDYSKEFTVNVEDKMKYTYGFVLKDHYNSDSSKINYTGITYFDEYTSETYAEGERNWKYYTMTDDTLAVYNAKLNDPTVTDLAKALRGIVGFDTGGLKFSPAGGNEWLAIKFRVPEAGVYKVSYTATANLSGVNDKAYISIMGGDETKESILSKSNGPVTSDYLLASGVDFNNSNTVNEERTVGNKVVAINEAGDELLFILTSRSGYTSPMRLRAFTLTKVDDEIKLDADSINLEEDGKSVNVKASLVNNTLLSATRPTYKIANTDIATVNAVGKVTSKVAGETTLTATIGDYSKTIPVVVTAKEIPAETPEYIEAFTPDKTETTSVTTSVGALAIAKDGSTVSADKSATKNSDGTYSVKADETSGEYKFLYWVKGLENGGKKRIVSFDRSFKYAPHNGANYLIAVYGKSGDEAAKNEYYNANGQLLANGDTLPSMAGYGTAKGWVDCGDGIFVAEYDDANIGSYEITINGAAKTYAYGDEVVCTAEAEKNGEKFFGWKKTVNGKSAILVSASKTYKFCAWENCSVEAVYKAEAATFSKEIRKIVLGTVAVGNKTAVMAEFIGFEDAIEKGITLGTADYAMTSSEKTQFTIVNDDDAESISGYAILRDGTKIIFNK